MQCFSGFDETGGNDNPPVWDVLKINNGLGAAVKRDGSTVNVNDSRIDLGRFNEVCRIFSTAEG